MNKLQKFMLVLICCSITVYIIWITYELICLRNKCEALAYECHVLSSLIYDSEPTILKDSMIKEQSEGGEKPYHEFLNPKSTTPIYNRLTTFVIAYNVLYAMITVLQELF